MNTALIITASISLLSALVSLTGVCLGVYFWHRANRPMVVAEIMTDESGNAGTTLELVVENVGNRPAKNVQLQISKSELDAVLMDDISAKSVRHTFHIDNQIPILSPKAPRKTAFGFLSVGLPGSTWREEATLVITISYVDALSEKSFRHQVPIKVANNSSFTKFEWGEPKRVSQ